MDRFFEVTLSDLQTQLQSGALSSSTLVESYLQRIDTLDQAGPTLNSVIERNPDALADAQACDDERQRGQLRGPLHGMPIMLKDNIATADKMMTTAGSLALEGLTAQEDAFLVKQLRQAGAVILGKTNLSEWANFRSTRSSSGWSSRGGQTKNPYVLDRNPCGSSSGSGVAVAASLCAAAIGTETDGSITCPASINGVVGLKPTVGLVSRSGIIPISHTQDTAGPMTRTVRDAAIVLGALVGIDPRDPLTLNQEGKAFEDYTQFLDPGGLEGARIGVVRNLSGFHEAVDALTERALEHLRQRGATLIDVSIDQTSLKESEGELLIYEFKHGLNTYLSKLGGPIKSLEALIEFNKAKHQTVMPYFGQERLLAAQEQGGLDEPAYLEALQNARRLSRDEGIDAALAAHHLDALIAPSNGPAWTTDLLNGDRYIGSSSTLAAVAGYPNISLPMGFVHGLPVGLSFFSTAYQEPTLLKLAYAFEQATQARRPPTFLQSLNLG